jgi:CheY-like chemotaxis protein
MLQKMGCRVDLAVDGASAVRSVDTKAYDIVLMDLLMPEVDGTEAARRIRRMVGPQSSIPIVALTASASAEVRLQCLQAGMNDFLSKPMELDSLQRALERWCRPAATMALPSELAEPA